MELAILRDKIGYHGVSLALATVLTGAALMLANHLTLPAIAQAAEDDLKASLVQVLPEGMADNNLLADTVSIDGLGGKPVTVYRGRKAGVYSAAVFQHRARGYAGDIVILVGLNAEGVVQGVRVLKHAETPGLGDKIEVAKSPWVHAFEGKALGTARWGVKKDGGEFDQFAGATITPRTVVKTVKEALEFYAAHRTEIAGEKP
ncbi:electron transport complex subunit RsxG [Uliginosibacterium flavum]|uniref:Ion-translocating oxidoreductase complex subunit G n=1 Tax=Uliginosibacterium flavum TaxID=1396831 RepID=A0ABV2TJ22_9RHOO